VPELRERDMDIARAVLGAGLLVAAPAASWRQPVGGQRQRRTTREGPAARHRGPQSQASLRVSGASVCRERNH